ncbi:tetratricopeptide repeat protein [Microscilla marina]|uniref:Tetratricopeptide repeat domain containing protein, putative n=1 Tax=Microscilla marina ATCC 23134 TaxID=313606 RepID=A1ZNJ5_MICM2|nr:tetratricopeptide repeat protein [Microscilla marina]EAY28106.1 tetratricopeptide repeat domain containing protein, putative [Microscilla marina ATCC 23134]
MRFLFYSILLIVSPLFTFAQMTPLEKAETYYNADKYRQAIRVLTQLVKTSPANHEAYLLLGASYWYGNNELIKAEQAFKQALRVAPKEQMVYDRYGDFLATNKRLADAQKLYEEGVKNMPQADRMYFHLGVVLHEQKKHNDALEPLNQAISLNPNKAVYHYFKGRCYEELKLYSQALQSFDQYVKLESDKADNYITRGRLKLEMKDYQGALADHTKAEELDSVAHNGAVEQCKHAIEWDYYTAYRKWEKKDLAKALVYAREGLKWARSPEDIARYKRWIVKGEKELAAREQAAKDAIINKKLLTEAEIFRQRGIALIKAKKYQEAAYVLEKGLMVLIKSAELALSPLYDKIYQLRKDCLAAVEEAKKKN